METHLVRSRGSRSLVVSLGTSLFGQHLLRFQGEALLQMPTTEDPLSEIMNSIFEKSYAIKRKKTSYHFVTLDNLKIFLWVNEDDVILLGASIV